MIRKKAVTDLAISCSKLYRLYQASEPSGCASLKLCLPRRVRGESPPAYHVTTCRAYARLFSQVLHRYPIIGIPHFSTDVLHRELLPAPSLTDWGSAWGEVLKMSSSPSSEPLGRHDGATTKKGIVTGNEG
jgi:hypothetical protein